MQGKICTNVKKIYQDLLELKASFSIEFQSAKETKDTSKAFELKVKLEQKILLLEEALLSEKEKKVKKASSVYSVWNKEKQPLQWKTGKEWNTYELSQRSDRDPNTLTFIENKDGAFLNFEQLIKEGKQHIFNPNDSKELDDWLSKNGLPKNIGSVMEFINKEMSSKYHTPGVELNEYLASLKEKDLEKIFGKIESNWKKNWYYMPGSAFRDSGGYWDVPFGDWYDGRWCRYGNWARRDWHSSSRVVLFGK